MYFCVHQIPTLKGILLSEMKLPILLSSMRQPAIVPIGDPRPEFSKLREISATMLTWMQRQIRR